MVDFIAEYIGPHEGKFDFKFVLRSVWKEVSTVSVFEIVRALSHEKSKYFFRMRSASYIKRFLLYNYNFHL